MEILGLANIPLYLILTVGAAILFYIYSTWNNDFFRKQGIPGPRPNPVLGNIGGYKNLGFLHSFHVWKQMYGKIYGIFMGMEPVFVISDLDILKEVLVKSFNNFRNKKALLTTSSPFNLGVVFLEDAAWKRVRNIITPTFSGGKLRAMCPVINECASTLATNFSRTFNKQESVNMKEYFGAYTMDVTTRTAFGIKVDSQNNLNDPFVVYARKFLAPYRVRGALNRLAATFPLAGRVLRTFGFNFCPYEVVEFFKMTIIAMIEERKMESRDVSQKRTDFLQLLMDAEIDEDTDYDGQIHLTDGHLSDYHSVRRLTTDEIVGQGMIFFLAGYETTATTLTFASHAFATHPDVQDKAYEEIKDVLNNDVPDYDSVAKLKYLENVLLETLRMYPPGVLLTRRASETITIKDVTIPKGFYVFVPLYSIQRDPDLYEEPDEFKPERHDRKQNPLSFLTFGYGPRMCIGMRLALIEAKIALVHTLREVKFEALPDTPKNLKFKPANVLEPVEPIKLKVSARNQC